MNSFRYYTFMIETPKPIQEISVTRQVRGDSERDPMKNNDFIESNLGLEKTSLSRSIRSNIYNFLEHAESSMNHKIYSCSITESGQGRKIQQIQPINASVNSNIIIYDGKIFFEFANGEIK